MIATVQVKFVLPLMLFSPLGSWVFRVKGSEEIVELLHQHVSKYWPILRSNLEIIVVYIFFLMKFWFVEEVLESFLSFQNKDVSSLAS